MKRLILGLVLIWNIIAGNSIAFAGIDLPTSVRIEDETDIFELAVEEVIIWDDYYTLSYFYQHPLDLNKVEISQLEELPNITPDLAQQIYDKRPFARIEEIIPIVGQEIFDQIKVFSTVKPIYKGNFELWLTETKDDNEKSALNTRLCFYTEDMELGVLGEREDKLKLKKRYLLVDKPSAFPRKTQIKICDYKVVLGNYQARFGEGVTYNTAHRKTYRGLVPDDGTRGTDIQDGLIVETSIAQLTSTFFYSWVDLDEFPPNSVLSGFDGKEKLWGENLSFTKKDTHIGATGYVSNFTSKDGEDERVEIVGIDFSKRFKEISSLGEAEIAGEIAKSKNQANGLFLRGYKKFSNFKYWLSLRRYEQDFINPHSQVAEGDEKGGSAEIHYDSTGLKVKLFGDYHQHFSTLITDEEYWSSMEYRLSYNAKITAKIEWEDTDIARIGDEKKVYSLALDTKPHFKLDINSYYRYTNDDGTITDYIYTKFIYNLKPDFTLTGRFKYGPDGNRETYGQVKIKMGEEVYHLVKELTAKYTYTHSNPQHKFYLRMKVGW
ncbi:MAG: hypothetical protein ABIF11_05970 [Nitrospirota bacterium]